MEEKCMIVFCVCCIAVVSGIAGYGMSDMTETRINNAIETPYSYTGEITDVRFIENKYGFITDNLGKTVVRFKSGKYLEFGNELHYEIQSSPNATIHYSVNRNNEMYFNSITYKK